MTGSANSALRVPLLASAIALVASPVFAQDYGTYGPPESVIVNAPRIRFDTLPYSHTAEKATMSVNVSYADLDLRTYQGARELRQRVREQARAICDTLSDYYPVRQMPGTSCYKSAAEDGLVHANEAIDTARQIYRVEYYGGY